MTFVVYIRHAAEQDVAEAQKWYENQQTGLANEFHAEFFATLGRLQETPFIYPAIYRTIRRAVLHRFPYLVWYKIHNSTVTVLAMHAWQN